MSAHAPRTGGWWQPRRDLSGKRAIVTGASSGVGRAVATALARRGCHVLATARREDRLAALASDQRSVTPIHYLAGDICNPEFRQKLVAFAVDDFGGLDLVVAAAGAGAVGPFRDACPDTLSRIVDLDFVAPAELLRVCLPSLARGRDPAIVLVGSILGLHPLPLHGEYAAAKAALRSLAGSLRPELAGDGIDVMVVTLGPVASEFWDSLMAGARPTWSRGHPISADVAAAAIVEGIERRRREIVPGWRAQAYAFVARYLPGLIDFAAARHLATEGHATDPRHHGTEP